ncbi:MAG: protein-export chaperone SecB [Alphaproteobacteria bacterium]|nr:protein-export chaperone SecB [Alphaproteobacteria bacterium]
MSDQAPANASPVPLQITVNVQYIKDFSFECPNAPQIFTATQTPPVLNMGINVQTRPLSDNVYEVLLLIKLEAKIEDKAAFIGELSYGGVLSVPPMPEEQLKIVLLVEAPRLLFPFARSVLANAVREGGFPQILINPIDFGAMYQAQAEQISKLAGTA